MDFDIIIIGAGLSGLTAAVRPAHYGKKVLLVERHALPGGLNSYFRRNGRTVDVGLHAVTNFADPGLKAAPLNRLMRQLRMRRESLDLVPQQSSLISFPGHSLTFTNDPADLLAEIERVFPADADGLRGLLEEIQAFDCYGLETPPLSARSVLSRCIASPLLRDMIFCPVMFYGNAQEDDMDFAQFCVIFRSVFLEGLCRPASGIRGILDPLLARLRECGVEIRLRCGVRELRRDGDRVVGVVLDDGTELTADRVMSCAGYAETLALCSPAFEGVVPPDGRLGYVESMFFLDRPMSEFGYRACIEFYSLRDTFRYRCPDTPVDFDSGVVCAPGNFAGEIADDERMCFRLTHLANPEFWMTADRAAYAEAKRTVMETQLRRLEARFPGFTAAVTDTDMFTPRTIHRYTGHGNGSIYGSPVKHRDGSTPLENLFVCGTDQGFLGIVGSMLSGVSIANIHLLQ